MNLFFHFPIKYSQITWGLDHSGLEMRRDRIVLVRWGSKWVLKVGQVLGEKRNVINILVRARGFVYFPQPFVHRLSRSHYSFESLFYQHINHGAQIASRFEDA